MESGKITRYSASAGSGKTFKLAGIYLRSLFSDPYSYRNILAVTFTNKATAEMKERILHNLYMLSKGKESEYSGLLQEATGKSPEKLKAEAGTILNRILHDYSSFSVGTIDSFFQKVLRSFARESGLQAGFNIVLDYSTILLRAVDELLKDSEHDEKLLTWLIEFGQREILEGKSWNLKTKILSLGEQIFNEKYRMLQENGLITDDREILRDSISKLYAFQNSFSKRLAELAGEAMAKLHKHGVKQDMLAGKSRSFMKFLDKAQNEVPATYLSALYAAADEEKYYSGPKASPELDAALADGLHDTIISLVSEYREKIRLYNSVRLVTDNLFTLGILNDIAFNTRKILDEQNKFLLADAGDILRKILSVDQAPFIYEKAGNRYKNFMIDEFQDTSRVQWDNFLPLISNSLAEGESSLVVGDIKQSIYRWRNSDWEIFRNIGDSFSEESFETVPLKENWRSSANIIGFNNALFSCLPGMIEKDLETGSTMISEVYADVKQNDPGKYEGGFVQMKYFESADDGREQALEQLPSLLEEIQDKGYSAGDIGILVRTRNEGQEVIDRIAAYASRTQNTGYSYHVISQDSLLLGSSPVIIFLVSVLRYLIENDNKVNRAVMQQYYRLAKTDNEISRPSFIEEPGGTIPNRTTDSFESFLDTVRYLSVFEIVDRVIDYTGTGRVQSNIPYLNTFQNCILDFAGTETNDIPAFLDWWENEGNKKSVSSSEQPDAMQLMTIHKSKGLQFRVVVLPFVSWPFKHEVNPFLWIYSDEELLKPLGAVPVKMKKDFENTVFDGFYKQELGRAAIDKLNMLYVAFTRARECLYANLLKTGKGKSAGDYIADIFTYDTEIYNTGMGKHWDDEKMLFSYGREPENKQTEKEKVKGQEIGYPLTLDDSRLRLNLHSKAYYSKMDTKDGDKRSYGLLMHEILSSIKTSNDIPVVLDDYLDKGIIDHIDRKSLNEKLNNALSDDRVKTWFSSDVEVKTERDILVPGGRIRRPDRLIFRDDRLIITDFKFGESLPGHKKQLEEYRKILQDMGYRNVDAFVWYPDESKVVEV